MQFIKYLYLLNMQQVVGFNCLNMVGQIKISQPHVAQLPVFTTSQPKV